MFLHETGDDSDSFSRADLSSLNAASTQRLAPSSAQALPRTNLASTSQAQPSHSTAPLPAAPSSTSQPAKSEAMSRSDSGDGSALPTTANWAKNPQVEQSRRSSQAASRATPSPKATHSKLVIPRPESRAARPPSTTSSESKQKASQDQPTTAQAPAEPAKPRPDYPHSMARLVDAFKTIANADFSWSLDRTLYDQVTLDLLDNYPPLIDPNGGVMLQRKRAFEQEKKREADKADQTPSIPDEEENLAGGSLQLGGEPENGDDILGATGNSRRQTPFGLFSNDAQPFDRQVSIGTEFSNLGGVRSLTPQQQRNISLLKSGSQQPDSGMEPTQRVPSGNTSQHHSQLSNPFQSQNQQLGSLSRHNRHASRFTFANDSSSASTAVKPSANPQLMAQQSSMMPSMQQKNFSIQQGTQPALHGNFYSAVQGPPPGLKATGTPPISGGGMFGQGHGFASAMAGGANFASNATAKTADDNTRDLMRGRMAGANSLGGETGKRELRFLSDSYSSSIPSTPLGLSSPVGVPSGRRDQGPSKPKNKGKRHRHANASSLGGGATVDLADPSILQARMHHSGIGQGQYGGAQTQGGYNSHGMMYGGGGGFGGRW